ncbi:MAG: DUF1670 domain-containing protein [Methanotrichaceae archaeon]|nr:DUF1670 domain-containing protein [Methanotrichaceae archaeon]
MYVTTQYGQTTQNYSQTEITKRTHHSGEAVDRYLRDYNRVKVLRGGMAVADGLLLKMWH